MRIISSDIKNTKNARYLDVHMLYTRVKPPPMMNPSEEHLVATISLLNVKGDPLDGYNRCLVEFNYVLSYIGKHQGTKNRFLFCHIADESIGEKFNTRNMLLFQQQMYHSQQKFLSQLSQNFGQILQYNQAICNYSNNDSLLNTNNTISQPDKCSKLTFPNK